MHSKSELKWYNREWTWDYPCDGSRFSYPGKVIEGPAVKPLQQDDDKMIDNR